LCSFDCRLDKIKIERSGGAISVHDGRVSGRYGGLFTRRCDAYGSDCGVSEHLSLGVLGSFGGLVRIEADQWHPSLREEEYEGVESANRPRA